MAKKTVLKILSALAILGAGAGTGIAGDDVAKTIAPPGRPRRLR